MGVKGAKQNQEAILYAELLAQKLGAIEGISMKRMFGGHGVFHEGKMFGIVDSRGNYFFKVDETNKVDFELKGSVKHSRMPYYEVPAQIFDYQDELVKWARKAIEASK